MNTNLAFVEATAQNNVPTRYRGRDYKSASLEGSIGMTRWQKVVFRFPARLFIINLLFDTFQVVSTDIARNTFF